ncbi:hypothetical protein DGG96_18420 [Legionella qingyii]|uniref:Uncharacterized protein n=2 Tax=Legionella qingyii TaxID=2184757 RepID=A0A317U112_9GAMM|nr:hypothetical protein DGG96_18420 [Legionella qingyii]RUR23616.1 hypothetical protein ELY16_13170 [Legionella qingyii]RUR24171.1 hypothetical protein ELY20_05850 [Legionella qingyii]
MMFFKRFATSCPQKVIKNSPTASSLFKEVDWSIVTEKGAKPKLNESTKVIVNELENSSSADAQGPVSKFK